MGSQRAGTEHCEILWLYTRHSSLDPPSLQWCQVPEEPISNRYHRGCENRVVFVAWNILPNLTVSSALDFVFHFLISVLGYFARALPPYRLWAFVDEYVNA